MIVADVKTENIDKLISVYQEGKTNENFKKLFGNRITALLNHVKINFIISDLGIFEYYFMKKLATTISLPNHGQYRISNSMVKPETYPERYSIIKQLEVIEQEIMNDEDIESIKDIYDIPFFLPIGMVKMDSVFVTFSGENILLFSNGFIEKFVESILNKTEEEIKNFFIQELIQSFYSFMATHVSNVDVLSEYAIQSRYYKYIGLKDITRAAEVSCPAGMMSFFGEASDHINEDIVKIRDFLTHSPDEKYRVEYSFILNTDIYTFLMIDQLCPWIKDHQPFKILIGRPDDAIPPYMSLYNDVHTKYKKRLEEIYKNYTSIKNVVVQTPEENLNRYNYILCNQKIKYTLSFSLSEFLQIVSISNDDVRIWGSSGSRTITDRRVSEIFKVIFKLIKNINSFIF